MIKQVDLGIGLSHFHQTALEIGLKGRFEEISEASDMAPEDFYYMISWAAEK